MRIVFALPFFAIAAMPAAHATSYIAVGTCLPNVTSLPTITAAIAAAGRNAIIKICPGTYNEQLTITKNLTFKGVTSGGSSQVLILPP